VMTPKPMKTLENTVSSEDALMPDQSRLERGTLACMLTAVSRSIAPLGLAMAILGCGYQTPEGPTASAGEVFQLCAQCHGADGQGNQKFNAPAIAGLPQWYVENQLQKFKSGVRGTHPADVTGMQMRPMGMSLANEADLKNIAEYVAKLPRASGAATLEGGDAEQGKTLYATCAACHGPDASGNEQLKAPPLKHGSDWYMLAQLHKFKEGHRGLAGDIEGATMRPQAAVLPDEKAMKDVVAYIATLK
jgi:cytochrome c553